MNPSQLLAFLNSIFEKGPKELPQRNPQAFDPGDDPLQMGKTPRPLRGFPPTSVNGATPALPRWTPDEDTLPNRVARPTPAGQARQGALLSALGPRSGAGAYNPPAAIRKVP